MAKEFGEQYDGPPSQWYKPLFDTYYQPIRNFLYYKCGDMQKAEDLCQEVFLIVWQRRDAIQLKRIKNLLYTIANNLFLNEVKHQKVVMKFQQLPVDHTFNQSPQFLMEEKEFEDRLNTAIADLPEINRVVFLMNRIEKLTYREIAERLNISEKAVEKRMHKALGALRQISERI